MENPPWDYLRACWAEDDGALSDIYVSEATADDWQRVIDATTARWASTYTEDAQPTPLPDEVGVVFRRTHSRACLLRIEVTPLISLNAHFFIPEEVEFGLDPRAVRDQAGLDAVTEFIRTLGRTLSRPVFIGCESPAPRPIEYLRYEPTQDRFVAPLG
jgi:hypothetical protein